MTSGNLGANTYCRYIFRSWRHSADRVEYGSSIISRRLNRFPDYDANSNSTPATRFFAFQFLLKNPSQLRDR